LRSLLAWHLQQAGYLVNQSATLQSARQAFLHRQPTLAIIDSDLPDGDGIELCRWLDQQKQSLILILSARNGEKDVVNGLKAGADDYLRKPFGMQEFMARVEVLTRRLGSRAAPLHLDYGQLKIDLAQRRDPYQEPIYCVALGPRKLIIPGQSILMFSLCGKKSKPIPGNLI